MTDNHIIATYLIETPIDVRRAAELLASEQSIGSFGRVRGETDEIVSAYGAKVIGIHPLERRTAPSLETAMPGLSAATQFSVARIKVTFPTQNFGSNLPSLLAILLGNLFELQELTGVRLEDIDIPDAFAAKFPGPAFGVAGTRELTGVAAGPLIGTIVKPKLGLSAHAIAALVSELGESGLHFIKDDECMTNPPSAPFAHRVQTIAPVLHRLSDKLGRRVMYAFNISDDADQMCRNHDLVAAAGGTCVMVSLNACGPSAITHIRRISQLPIHAHRAGWGMLTRHPLLGMGFTAYQKLWRLAGVDQMHVGGLQSKFFEDDASVLQSARECLTATDVHKGVMPVFSSGQWGGQAAQTFQGVGSDDLIYLAGGGILGHPGGPKAGVKGIADAWQAAKEGVPLEKYAMTHPELRASIDAFGGLRVSRGGING